MTRRQPVEVAQIGRHDLIESLSLVGTVEANESAQIHPEIAGIVKHIYFNEGQQVRAGEVLLKVDDSELAAQASQAEAAFKLAEQTLKRVEGLRKSRSLPETEFDRTVSAYDSAHAELELIRSRLAKTAVKAPFDGTVGARSISPGDYVTPQTAITSVDDLSRLKVTFDVPERYLNKAHIGTTLAVKASGIRSEAAVTGKVYFVSSTINRNTRASQVKGVLERPPPALKPGMFANVELVLDVRKQALTVPEAAIFRTISGPKIVIARTVNDGYEAAFVPVELGLRSEGMVEISSAEPIENQQVVAAGVGALALYPGTRLDPRPAVGTYSAISQY